MSGQSEHVLLRPFNEVVKWARVAAAQAAYPYGGGGIDDTYLKSPMAISSGRLLKEGERAFRRLSPLVENPSSQLSQHLRQLMLKDEVLSSKLRAINVILYDFEDYVEPNTYEEAKFVELETATRDLALTLIEHITTFTTQSALDPLPASKFPALPPLPPLPTRASQPRPDSRMTTRTAPSGTISHTIVAPRRPSQGPASDGRDEFSRQDHVRSTAYSDSTSPISPTTPSSMPFPPHLTAEQDRAMDEQSHRTHRQRLSVSNANTLPVLMDRVDISGVTTPPSSAALSRSSSNYRSPVLIKGRGSNGYLYQDTPPGSDIAEGQEYPFGMDQPVSHTHVSPMDVRTLSSANEFPTQTYSDSRSEMSAELLQKNTSVSQTFRFSEMSGGSNEPLRTSAASTSSGTARTRDSMSAKSVHQFSNRVTGLEIGATSSINLLKGFCKGARNFASAGPGRAIKRIGALEGQVGGGSGPNGQDMTPEMLFGSMLGATGAETSSDPKAQCQSCEYSTLYSILRQDIEQDPLANQRVRGVTFRSRFLWKSHLAVKGLDIFFGCLFCDKAKATCHDGDATVFQSVDLLMRHISRHSHPLPPVAGLTVLYENDARTSGRQDYDILFASPVSATPYTGLPASEVDRVATLPVGLAIKDNIRRRNERPQAKPSSNSEVLQFLNGARILGVEFPEEWEGKWCKGWHEGAYGVFSSKIITLEMPHLINTATLPKTMRTGVTRWKFEAKSQKGSGWLTFSKGETIYNLAWDDPHAWFWSGSNSKGLCGIFPKSHISIGSIEDGSLGSTSRSSAPKEKSRFGLFSKR